MPKVEHESRHVALNKKRERIKHITKEVLHELYTIKELPLHEVVCRMEVPKRWVYELMSKYKIPVRDAHTASKKASEKYWVDETFFDVIDTPDKAYIVGFFNSDGHICGNSKGCRLTCEVAEQDGDHLVAMASRFADPAIVKRNIIRPGRPTEQPSAGLVVARTRLARALVSVGIPFGAKSGIEPFVDFGSSELNWAFIRGMFDGDGCISNAERHKLHKDGSPCIVRTFVWSICTGRPFIERLATYLPEFGITLSKKSVLYEPTRTIIRSAERGAVQAIGKLMYASGTLWLERKRAKFSLLDDIVQSKAKVLV